MGSSNTNDLQQTITAESNLQDVASLVASMRDSFSTTLTSSGIRLSCWQQPSCSIT